MPSHGGNSAQGICGEAGLWNSVFFTNPIGLWERFLFYGSSDIPASELLSDLGTREKSMSTVICLRSADLASTSACPFHDRVPLPADH